MTDFSICSFSFHRTFLAGGQDVFQYIETSRRLGASHLHCWLPHLLREVTREELASWEWRPGGDDIPPWMWAPTDRGWLDEISAAVRESGLRHEMLAMEKGYLFVADQHAQAEHRRFLRGWLACCAALGIPAMRVDPGGGRDIGELELHAILAAYDEVMPLARELGVRLFIENHWGAIQRPDVILRLLDEVEGLGYLFDTNNWGGEAEREEGWRRCAQRADATHIKTLAWNDDGSHKGADLERAIALLRANGYAGVWGIESMPADGDEEGGVVRTMQLIERCLAA